MHLRLAKRRRKTRRVNFVTHLECANCAKRYPAGQAHNLCTDCHRPLWVRYDLEQLRVRFPRESLVGRPIDLWRYRELLPYIDAGNVVSLGETATPILSTPRLGAELGLAHPQIKDESRLPTGSFKARGMAPPALPAVGQATRRMQNSLAIVLAPGSRTPSLRRSGSNRMM